MKKVRKFFKNIGDGIKSGFKFLSTSTNELKAVEWLSRKETLKFSGFVLLFLSLTAVIIAVLDLLFYRGLILIIS